MKLVISKVKENHNMHVAYFVTAVIYKHKMFMKLAAGVKYDKTYLLWHQHSDSNKPECLT
jgi:hypothetical protein